jgi:hypothetical protein
LVATLGVAAPGLDRAADRIRSGGAIDSALRGRIAASGGVTAVLFVVIIFLMVYRPG